MNPGSARIPAPAFSRGLLGLRVVLLARDAAALLVLFALDARAFLRGHLTVGLGLVLHALHLGLALFQAGGFTWRELEEGLRAAGLTMLASKRLFLRVLRAYLWRKERKP